MSLILTVVRRMTALGLCTAATLTAPFTTLPAHAAPGARLVITVTPQAGGAYAMLLTCDPDGGLHPSPLQACDELREVDGHFPALNVDPGPCPDNWDPVVVEANGNWYGRPNSYYKRFSNSCEMTRALGPVV
ncbi:SSI family serine proteinase inhibitor [Nonomuraea sp. NPDC050404]|uniref:SSI family serine proteinase inhibitor n=1 Tax=Nonomuraea sp. NPDC050404 TaxID=3155783 RepID=UPI0033E0C441